MIQALRSAMDVMLTRDANVVVFGQDVGYFGGVFRCTEGLQAQARQISACSMRRSPRAASSARRSAWAPTACARWSKSSSPTTVYPASDQIVSEAARLRYRSAGDFTAPLTIRMPCGGGIFGGQTHSQSPEALFTHVCGLRTVMPSNPYDAKGLLIAVDRGRRPGHLPGAQAALQRPVRRPPRPAGGAVDASTRWARCPRAITPCRSAGPRIAPARQGR